MTKLLYTSFAYMLIGVSSGLFYREFTKALGFPEGDFTQLSVVHTHLLVLGFLVFLVVLVLEKLFSLTKSKLFGWFFWIYNLGLIVTAGALTAHGMLTVSGAESGKAIAGIAGAGHTLLAAGMVLLFLALRNRIKVDGLALKSGEAPKAN